jgi:signal-transduction protein with cAMP-binding, CBS, and nucleotidyltransferase domain
VVSWFRHYASKFVYLLSPNPDLRERILSSLAKKARVYSFEEGECICMQGESSDNVFLLYSGTVQIMYMPAARDRKNGVISEMGKNNDSSEQRLSMRTSKFGR